MSLCERLGALVDGELSQEEADAMHAHLATCKGCGERLQELLMLEALVSTHVGALEVDAPRAPPTSPSPLKRAPSERRSRTGTVIALGTATVLAAAAGWAVVASKRPVSPTEEAPIVLAQGPTRNLEVRFAHPAAAKHAPYDVARGDEKPAGVPFDVLATMEKRGDVHGVAVGMLLGGERDRAGTYFDRAPASPDTDADRAALAIVQGKPERALELADRALEARADHPVALFNRALALRDVGAPLAAAAAFERVALLEEGGWSDEATARARALRAEYKQRETTWRAAKTSLRAMVAGGALPDDALVRAQPDLVRHFVYETLRHATPERASALSPLAKTLGDAALGKRIDAIARRAHAAELAKMDDEWLRLDGEIAAAAASGARGDVGDAERRLREAIARAERFDYLRVRLELALARLLVEQHRTVEAEKLIVVGLEHARAHAADQEYHFVFLLADAARLRGGVARLRAHLEDGIERAPDACLGRRFAHELLAEARMLMLDPTGARRELDLAPRCDAPMTMARADTLANLARVGAAGPEFDSFSEELARARAKLTPGESAFADVVEGRATMPRDRAAGMTLVNRGLASALRLPAGDAIAMRARSYAHLTIAVEEARTNAALSSLVHIGASVAETANEGALGEGCVLGVAMDDERSIAVTRDASGAMAADVLTRTKAAPSPEDLVPSAVRDRLASCAHVSVVATPPLHGMRGLLPSDMAWSYRTPRATPSAPASAEPRRLVVADVMPPAALGLPRLAPWSGGEGATQLTGANATPSHVLDEMAHATEIEIHAHGLVDLAEADASWVALSPDARGRFALTAADVRARALPSRPVVVLAACRAAHVAPHLHKVWSLPRAFTDAGARAVFASPEAIRDAEAGRFFDGVLARIRAGAAPATALRDERAGWAKDSWVRDVLLFE